MDRWQREYVRLVADYMNEVQPLARELERLELCQPASVVTLLDEPAKCETIWSPEAAADRDRLLKDMAAVAQRYLDRIAQLARDRVHRPHPGRD